MLLIFCFLELEDGEIRTESEHSNELMIEEGSSPQEFVRLHPTTPARIVILDPDQGGSNRVNRPLNQISGKSILIVISKIHLF